MKRLFGIALAVALLVSPVVAKAQDLFSGANIGTILGAGAGAVGGSQFGKGKGQLIGVAVGTLGGAFLGRELGASVDRSRQMDTGWNRGPNYQPAPSYPVAAPYPQASAQPVYYPPQQPVYVQQAPVAVQQNSANYCREVQYQGTVNNQPANLYGTACRQPDGTWRLVN
jgi:surface antigen